MSVLRTHEAHRGLARDKQAAANTLQVLRDPVSPIVLTDHEQRRLRPRGGLGLFYFVHQRGPSTKLGATVAGESLRRAAMRSKASIQPASMPPRLPTSSSSRSAGNMVAHPTGALWFSA